MTDLDIDSTVAEATSEETFDALDYFSNSTLPEASVTLYRDTAAAFRLNEIADIKASIALREEDEGIGLTDDDVEYVDEDEVAALTTSLKNSAVIFKLRAVAPAARTAMEKSARAKNPPKDGDDENTEYWEAFNANLIAKTILSVSDAKGRQDTQPWTPERVLKFAEVTESSEWQKVFLKVSEINFVSDAIDRAVHADF